MKTTLLMLYREIITICCVNCTKRRSKLCGQGAEFFNIKTGGTYIHYYNFKGNALKLNLRAVVSV
jgi:hypothetical protein